MSRQQNICYWDPQHLSKLALRRPRLFQKFVASEEMGATGLGMYISKRIVEAHGGMIWAANNTDSPGATITFTLPLRAKTYATMAS